MVLRGRISAGVAPTPMTGAGGGAAAPTTYEGLVATRLRFPNQFTTTKVMAHTLHTATDAISSLKVAFANFRIVGGGDTTGIAQEQGSTTTTSIKAAIEYPIGSARQGLNFSGARTGTIPAASAPATAGQVAILISDALTLSTQIPSGAAFRVWFYYSGANNPFHSDPATKITTVQSDGRPGDAIHANGAEPDVVDSGTFADQGFWAPVGVCAIIGQTTKHSSLINGDSIAYGIGYNRDKTNDFRVGIIAKGFPTDHAFINCASASSKAQTYLSEAISRKALWPYVSLHWTNIGRNDTGAGRTAAQIAADRAAINADPAWRAGCRHIGATLIPDATSTTGFANETNQATTVREATRLAVNNTYIRPGAITGQYAPLEMADVFEVRDTGKWKPGVNSRVVADGAITAGTKTLTSPALAAFTSVKDLYGGAAIAGAAAAGAYLTGEINAVASGTSATLGTFGSALNATNTVAAASMHLGANTSDGIHPTGQGEDAVATAGIVNTLLASLPAPV